MKLREIQSGVQDYVLKLDAAVAPGIADSGELSAMMRLDIYAEAYRLRLVEVLTVQYPVLNGWMGSDDFERLAVAYIDAQPSRHFSVRWFGDGLGDFLKNTPPFSERPALEEMARFEWAQACAFDAADTPPLQHTDLTAIPAPQWPYLVFFFHPGIRRMDCRWNTVPIWQAVSGGREAPDAVQTDELQAWLIWRTGLATRFRSLSTLEAGVLDCARGGGAFADQCALMARDIAAEQVASELAAMLGVWVRDGFVTGIKTGPVSNPE